MSRQGILERRARGAPPRSRWPNSVAHRLADLVGHRGDALRQREAGAQRAAEQLERIRELTRELSAATAAPSSRATRGGARSRPPATPRARIGPMKTSVSERRDGRGHAVGAERLDGAQRHGGLLEPVFEPDDDPRGRPRGARRSQRPRCKQVRVQQVPANRLVRGRRIPRRPRCTARASDRGSTSRACRASVKAQTTSVAAASTSRTSSAMTERAPLRIDGITGGCRCACGRSPRPRTARA